FEGYDCPSASAGNRNSSAKRRDTRGPLSSKVRARNYMAALDRLVSIEDLRQAARRRLPRAIFDFFDGGAEDEVTLRENRAAFERLAEEAREARLWFQLYAVREHEFREKLIARARNAGYEAMLVTVDLPVSGKRERDPRNGFRTPYNPNWRNSRDVIFKPAWLLEIMRHGLPGMANFDGYKFSTPSGTDIATAVGREMTVLLDGGVRRGVDILKARALGAHAVLTGRATLFGAMAGGEAGARRALEILASELERAMQLCGVRSVAEISADLLAPN